MIKTRYFSHSIAIIWILIFSLAASVSAQTTEFSYQGFLNDNNASANGSFDLEFRMFSSPSGGAALNTVQRLNVPVANGVFSVTLDFGAFPTADRFLEIGVRPAGGGAFTTLTPRSKILSTPFATNALNATTATNATQLAGVVASQYVRTADARLTDARNPLANSPNYIQNSALPQAASNFNISGNGTAGGTLSGNIVNATTQYNIGGNRILSSAGTLNLFAGANAGTSTTSSGNAFFGALAGNENSTGGSNAFFGTGAGAGNGTGSENAFFGTSAGAANGAGNGNAFFGAAAGSANAASDNSFFGRNAGRSNTVGSNSFFGANAGRFNTTGTDNAIFGLDAGRSATGGNRNAFFGTRAGSNGLSGNDNAFFGTNAGQNSTGGSNAFFGGNAGQDNTGINNAFFGKDSGRNNIGSNNTFVGKSAGTLNTSGSNNVFIGDDAGISNISGSNNTVLGAGADTSGSNLTFVTVIGAGASSFGCTSCVTIGRADDAIRIPGYLYVNKDTNLYGDVDIDGRVGINVLSPAQQLDVGGNIRIGSTTSNNGCVEDRNGTVIAGNCSSDVRFKKNVTPLGNILNNFSKLRPVNFLWRADEFPDKQFGTKQSFGLIAQEVEEAFPDLVLTDAQGYRTVNYSKLPLLTIQAVNELKIENDALNQQIRQQQTQIEKQQDEHDTLRTQIGEQKKRVAMQQNRLDNQQAEIHELKKIVSTIQAGISKPKPLIKVTSGRKNNRTK